MKWMICGSVFGAIIGLSFTGCGKEFTLVGTGGSGTGGSGTMNSSASSSGTAGDGGKSSATTSSSSGTTTSSTSSSSGTGGSPGCNSNEKKCAGKCVSEDDPAYGCAAADCTPCDPAHAIANCSSGGCGHGACEALYGDCDGDVANGCETGLVNNAQNCGSCGNVCPSLPIAASCNNGQCMGPCGPIVPSSICIFGATVPSPYHLGFAGAFAPSGTQGDPIDNPIGPNGTCINATISASSASCQLPSGATSGDFAPGLHACADSLSCGTQGYLCDTSSCNMNAVAYDKFGQPVGFYMKGDVFATGKLSLQHHLNISSNRMDLVFNP